MRTGIQPQYRTTVNYTNATNRDIIQTIQDNYQEAVKQTKEFAPRFQGETAKETAYNVWKFLRNYITYDRDDDTRQIIRLPSWFIHTQRGDCKSYSLLAASVLANLGLPVKFRYASYRWLNPTPSHVYVVTRDEKGKEIIVDGVWHLFNSEKPPVHKKESAMDVITMAGIEDVAGIGRRRRRGLSFAKKIALAPNRRAFRTLVSLNIFGLARKLQKTRAKNPGALKKFWENLGGKYAELEKSIRKGYNHWAKHHKRERISGVECCVAGDGYYDSMERTIGLAGIGALPAVAALIAAGAPIVKAVSPIVKKSGADQTERGEPPMDEAVQQSADIRKDNPSAESQMTVSGLQIGLAIGARKKRKGRGLRPGPRCVCCSTWT